MTEEKTTEDFPLEKTRSTPKTGAEANRNKRDRTSELPADKVAEMRKEVNNTANQTIGDGAKEVQGKLAIPHAKVMKRGQTMWTDEDGNVHKELNDEELNAQIAKEEIPEYLKLHQEVLNGAEPIEANLKYQNKDEKEPFAEGRLPEAELHPRTRGLGQATAAENKQDG